MALRAVAGGGKVTVLGKQTTAVSKSDANTTETALYTLTIPGGTLGANDSLRVTYKVTHPNSATNKTVNVRLGGVAGTILQGNTATTTASMIMQALISNRNSVSSQIGMLNGTSTSFGGSGSSLLTGALNTANAQDLVITATWGTAGAGSNNITLEDVLVEHIKN